MRAVRAVVAAGLLLAGTGAVLAPSQAVAPCASTGTIGKLAPNWQTLTPKFTAGPAAVTHVAAPAYAPDLLYATNGLQVVRSTDAGCSWKVVLDLREQLATNTTPTIVSLLAPSSANNSSYLYVGAQVDLTAVAEAAVWISPDRGATWSVNREADGLPLVGALRSMTASPRLPQVGYALISDSVAGRQLRGSVWATVDGGATWKQRTPTGQSLDASSLEAGPLQENQLLALSGGALVSSGDGGASFHTAGLGATDITSFDQAGGGGGIRLVAGHSGSKKISRSDDGGSSWVSVKTPVIAERVALGPLLGAAAVGGPTGTWLLVNPFVTVDLTTPGAQPQELQVSAPSAAGFAVTGVRAGAVVRATLSLSGELLPPGLRPIRLLPFDPLHQFPSTLTPVHTRVELPAGGTTRIPYTLLLPRTPSPLDVMFLVDTTGSMGGVIDGLRQGIAGIVSALNGSGLDVRVGLGDFKDYAAPHGGGSPGDYPYRLDRRIGLADESLRRAIENLSAAGGGDGQESALTALVEAATGHGETVDGVQFVAPGGQAGYRARTLRLDVIATDVYMRKRDGQRAGENQNGDWANRIGYTMAETIRTLRKADVHAVGLALGDQAAKDMRQLAEGTGTLAPEGGVDCDGDGKRDVSSGKPLVCSLGDSGAGASASVGAGGVGVGTGGGGGSGTVNLAGAVIGLAESLPDLQRVSLKVTQGSAYAELVGKTVRNGVNLKADNDFAYSLQLSCPRRSGAGSHQVSLAAKAAARQVATASVELVCAAGPRAAVPLAGLIDPPGADPKGAPAPPAQPPQAPNPNPNPNPNANPNVNPNINANFGAAAQEQQTQQLALVHSDAVAPTEELAMSRAAPGPPAGLLVSTAGLMFVVACAFAVRARSAVAHDTG